MPALMINVKVLGLRTATFFSFSFKDAEISGQKSQGEDSINSNCILRLESWIQSVAIFKLLPDYQKSLKVAKKYFL